MASVMGRVSPLALLYLPESSGPCSGPTPGLVWVCWRPPPSQHQPILKGCPAGLPSKHCNSSFSFYIQVYDPFQIHFYIQCEVGVKAPFRPFGHPVFPAPGIESLSFTH